MQKKKNEILKESTIMDSFVHSERTINNQNLVWRTHADMEKHSRREKKVNAVLFLKYIRKKRIVAVITYESCVNKGYNY